MSNVKETPRVTPPVAKDSAAETPSAHPSGRAKFDSRGNAVWEWQTEDGEFSTDVSTQRIKKLEAPELSIEETARVRKLGSTCKDTDHGFNPYDHAVSRGAKDPDAKKQIAPPVKSAAEPRKPVKDLKRLQEWMEMKKRLATQKDEE
jgi:hypothetical protein